jgi:sensor domain CHASE-containing protein
MLEKPCRYCCQTIDARAKKCQHCGSQQNPIINKLQSASLVLSILVAGVSILSAIQADRRAQEAESAKNLAEEALANVKQLDGKLTQDITRVDDDMNGLGKTISRAKSDITKLINVESKNGALILDIDNKVRIQWGKFVTLNRDEQDEVKFPYPFANDEVSVALTIVGNPARFVEGKSVIAKNLSSSGFIPKVSDNRNVVSGVEVNFVAFGKTPK